MNQAYYRVGIGHDTHRLEPGGPLRLGGIDIPYEFHAVGHSDADVVMHAITDAILGAAALGDIGDMFPDTDETNRNRDSGEMMQLALDRVNQLGFRLNNLDCIIFAERPKLAEYKQKSLEKSRSCWVSKILRSMLRRKPVRALIRLAKVRRSRHNVSR
ncbi:MAG: 2-C-methyl-D-erythritol 2,4-cyclodiphosphate synthase [Pirellulaceae bacterium]